MTQVEQAKLAAEFAAQADAISVDWSSVPELTDYHAEVKSYAGKPETLYFNELVAEYEAIKAEVEFRETRLKDLKEALSVGVMISGKQKVTCNGWKMAVVEKSGSKKILPEKLVAKGVSPEIIAECTQVSAGTTYVDLRRIKEKD